MANGDPRPERTALGSKKPKIGKAAINRHEQELADKLGGYRQPQSGALDHAKGDVSISGSMFSPDQFLLDSKETTGSTMILAVGDITKVCREALEVNKEPGLIITFGIHPQIVPAEWVAVPLEVFAGMLERLKRE